VTTRTWVSTYAFASLEIEESDFAEENPLEDEVLFELLVVVVAELGIVPPRSLKSRSFWSIEFFSCGLVEPGFDGVMLLTSTESFNKLNYFALYAYRIGSNSV